MKGKLVLIIGPSGVGKSVVLHALRKRIPSLHMPRSATTRERRPREKDDLYHFLRSTEFDALIREGKFLEWATVHGGARYGTLLEEIIPKIEEGEIVLREVDVQGFDSIRSHPLFHGKNPPYTLQSIFILPENTEQLIERIKRRAPISEGELQHRIQSMEKELRYADLCTARVINREGKLKETVEEVEKLIRGI